MSPRAKSSLLNIGAVTGAIVTIGGAAWGGGSHVVTLADDRYASRDSLMVYQAAEAKRHAVDSLNLREALSDLRTHQDSVAAILKVCIRHPEDCR